MARRFDPDFFDRECPHGLGQKSWCVLCNGREPVSKAKPPKDNAPDKPPKPKCTVCQKKAEKNIGHNYHRRYVKVTDPAKFGGRNPERAIAFEQKRAIWDATHTDDAGRLVCDECCNNRCTRCKSYDPTAPKVVVAEARADRVSVSERLLFEDSGMWQHLTGASTRGET